MNGSSSSIVNVPTESPRTALDGLSMITNNCLSTPKTLSPLMVTDTTADGEPDWIVREEGGSST